MQEIMICVNERNNSNQMFYALTVSIGSLYFLRNHLPVYIVIVQTNVHNTMQTIKLINYKYAIPLFSGLSVQAIVPLSQVL